MRRYVKFFILLIAIVLMLACSKGIGENYNNKIKLINSFPIEVSRMAIYLVHSNAIYVANIQNDFKTRKYDFNGNLLFEFGNKGKGPGEFIFIFNLFYDVSNNYIGIHDPAIKRITYIDTLGNLIKTDKYNESGKELAPFGIKNSSTANVKLLSSVDKKESKKMFFNYELLLNQKDKKPQIIKKENLLISWDFSKNSSLYVDLNEKYIFYCKFPHQLEFKPPNYFITIFDYSGNPKEWKPKFVPSKIKKMSLYQVSEKYIFISASNGNSEYKLIYDFSGNYLGYLKFKGNGGVVAVKNDKIFVLNDSGDDSILEIYEINF